MTITERIPVVKAEAAVPKPSTEKPKAAAEKPKAAAKKTATKTPAKAGSRKTAS